MYIQWQVGEGERRAVFLQEGPKEGIIVSFTCPSLKRQKVDVIVGASSEDVRACLRRAFRAICAQGFDVRKALSSVGIVFPNGCVPREGPGDSGKFLGGVVGHIEEMVFGRLVFDGGSERFSVTSHVEPVSPAIGRKAGERLPLFVGLGHVFVKEMLPQEAPRHVVRGGHIGGKTINCFVEGDAGVRWTVGEVEPNAWIVLKEVQEQQIDACGRGLAGADGRLEEGLNDALVVNEEVHVLLVDSIVVRGKPRQGALKGRQFGVKGGSGEDPVRVLRDGDACMCDDGGVSAAFVFFPESAVCID